MDDTISRRRGYQRVIVGLPSVTYSRLKPTDDCSSGRATDFTTVSGDGRIPYLGCLYQFRIESVTTYRPLMLWSTLKRGGGNRAPDDGIALTWLCRGATTPRRSSGFGAALMIS